MEPLTEDNENMMYHVDSGEAEVTSDPLEIDTSGTNGTTAAWHDPLFSIKQEPQDDSNPEVILPDWSYLNPVEDIESEQHGPIITETVRGKYVTKRTNRKHLSSGVEAPSDVYIQVEELPVIVNMEDKQQEESEKRRQENVSQQTPEIKIEPSELDNSTKKNVYICQPCGKNFKQRSNLKLHIDGVHRKQQPFQCDLCQKKFTQKSSLKRHHFRAHKKNYPLKCQHCGANISIPSNKGEQVYDHLREEPKECQYCRKKFGRQIAGVTFASKKVCDEFPTKPDENAERSKTKVPKKRMSKEEISVKKLEKRINKLGDSKTAMCRYPKRNIPKKQYTEEEITIEESFVEFPFFDQVELESKTKVEGEEFCCQIDPDSKKNENIQQLEKIQVCEEKVQNKDSDDSLDKSKLCSCVKSWTHLDSHDFDTMTDLVYIGPLPYMCKVCGKEIPFTTRKGSQTIHSTDQEQNSPRARVKKHDCPQCGKKFCVRSNVEQHIRTVHLKEKLFECPHCGQKFGQCGDMKHHVQSVHLKMKPFECRHCGQKFGRRCDMKKHIRTVHLKEKYYECQHCGQMFALKTSMNAHIQTVHLKEKLFECQHCGQRFGEKSNMRAHVRTVHLKVKQYVCQHCGQKFGWSCDMKKHVRIVHLKQKPFECQHCWQRFGEKSAMKKHVYNAHLNEKLNASKVGKGLVAATT